MTARLTSITVYIVKSILLGLAIAGVLLLISPNLRQQGGNGGILTSNEPAPLTFSDAVRRAAPAVVNVYTRSLRSLTDSQPAKLRPQGLGSGVLMSKKGYILTNYHVIADADQIIVALQDGRIFTAELIGSDIYTDLAVLYIESDHLPVIPQNQEAVPMVGDVVLAIGNPYNLGQTITQGIVSATGRSGMASTSYQDFLQTDAAINRGNSGGALVNSLGQLVGINTAAFYTSPNVESQGISFAIPYQLAHKIMTKLIADGRVIRGYLGITGQQINPVLAKQLKLGSLTGVVIDNMEPNGPAAKGGLLPNDVMIKMNNKAVEGVHDAMDRIAETRPGTSVKITVMRRGELLELPVTVQEPPALPGT
ncbi:outer membrane-stress sensor serine endopeptidase DegS [Corallincola platygyrae]|uniref:Outer membrane-stress sensor serine endopeptidase DegS n=1 Tax=Corallincola platygyrae TaxID=1193278 RepID=A0ABW4XRQ7_9GAMM